MTSLQVKHYNPKQPLRPLQEVHRLAAKVRLRARPTNAYNGLACALPGTRLGPARVHPSRLGARCGDVQRSAAAVVRKAGVRATPALGPRLDKPRQCTGIPGPEPLAVWITYG